MGKLVAEFKGVSIGKTTARIGSDVKREDMNLADADELFCGSRVEAKISCDPQGDKDPEGQKTTVDTSITLETTADVKGYSVKTDVISSGLTVVLSAIDIAKLAHFSNRRGTIEAKRIGAASAGEDD